METFQLIIKKKKSAGLINFLKQLDFVEIKEMKTKNGLANKNLADIIIPATNPTADISGLFGAWKDSGIKVDSIRKNSDSNGILQN